MMAMVRCNVPSVFIFGGATLTGSLHGKPVSVLTTYEAAGAVMTGAMPVEELDALERAAVPTFGACPGQFTANTMGMVSEMLGLAPLGSSMIPAVFEERAALARSAGQLMMQLLKDGGPLPRDLVTRASLENACAIVAATGGSTNAALHIPAIAFLPRVPHIGGAEVAAQQAHHVHEDDRTCIRFGAKPFEPRDDIAEQPEFAASHVANSRRHRACPVAHQHLTHLTLARLIWATRQPIVPVRR
jgi:Dehydratase family